jgi:hypothetical protein
MIDNSNERLIAALVQACELLRDGENEKRIPREVALSTRLRLDLGIERLRCADAS